MRAKAYSNMLLWTTSKLSLNLLRKFSVGSEVDPTFPIIPPQGGSTYRTYILAIFWYYLGPIAHVPFSLTCLSLMYTGNDRFSGNIRCSGLQEPVFSHHIRRYLYYMIYLLMIYETSKTRFYKLPAATK